MKQHQFASVAGLITLSWAIVSFASLASAQTGSGWVQLFDGKSLDGWNKVGESNWRVEDGAIVRRQPRRKPSPHPLLTDISGDPIFMALIESRRDIIATHGHLETDKWTNRRAGR